MFHKEAIRLLRDSWASTRALAEEIYAILQKKIPLFHEAPVTISTDDDEAPLVLRRFGGDGQVIDIRGPQDEPIGGIYLEGDRIVYRNRNDDDDDGGGDGDGGTTTFPAQVISGAENSYTCSAFPNGSGGGTTGEISVRVPGVAAGESIPAGTWIMVSQVNGAYEGVAALWQ